MPQTKYVLRHAMQRGLKVIVIINKIDRKDARIPEVINLTQDLFLELATTSEQLDYPVLYSSGRAGFAVVELSQEHSDISPVFEAILATVPPPEVKTGPFQMLVSNLDYDSHKGRISIGRIWRGGVAPRDSVVRIDADGKLTSYQVAELFTFLGLKRIKVDKVEAGDICALTGIEVASIGDTIASPLQPEALPRIEIGEPTVEMTFVVNTSPLAGKEGKFCTTRQLRERLIRELDTNLSLRVQDTDSSDTFLVKGRGELHLAILIETMRREGYEFAVSKPEAITKLIDGKVFEPVETLTVDTSEKYIGALNEMLSKRQARMMDMRKDENDNVRLVYQIPTKGLLGFRSAFLTATRGEGIMNTSFLGYEPWRGGLVSTRNGVLVASEAGFAITYGLNNAQERGQTFIEPGTQVYEGMIVGLNSRLQDIPVNVCR
ncbi:MAG: GTP-binding protein, partial [Chloroflexota bacterium]